MTQLATQTQTLEERITEAHTRAARLEAERATLEAEFQSADATYRERQDDLAWTRRRAASDRLERVTVDLETAKAKASELETEKHEALCEALREDMGRAQREGTRAAFYLKVEPVIARVVAIYEELGQLRAQAEAAHSATTEAEREADRLSAELAQLQAQHDDDDAAHVPWRPQAVRWQSNEFATELVRNAVAQRIQRDGVGNSSANRMTLLPKT